MNKSVGENDNLQEKVEINTKMSDCYFGHQKPRGPNMGAPQQHETGDKPTVQGNSQISVTFKLKEASTFSSFVVKGPAADATDALQP
jgi:hypothetical protein